MRMPICFLAAFFVLSAAFSQPVPDSTIKKIDSIFRIPDIANSPGYAIAVVRNDSVIYSKGYGMANLEYNIPITPETIFHMASVSKQFAAYSIVLLAKQGKLKLDDDIRKYLTWFPNLKQKITIRHLLNHTSGIRDQWQLLAISGTRLNDVITQDHIVKILSQQRALNFEPGERYSYSNSGYTMLAEIVKSVTGQTLRQFCDSAIFKPLKMNHTHFHDDAGEVVKNRAYSYDRIDSAKFENAILSYSNAGATSLFTNATDLAKWIMNYYQPAVGDKSDIASLVTNGKLNDGRQIPYALGILNDKEFGWTRYSHSGGDAGFRTFMSVFPDLKMGFLVFSNFDGANPVGKTSDMARLFIRDTSAAGNKNDNLVDSSLAILKDSNQYKNMAGQYISEEGINLRFFMKGGQMYVSPGSRDMLMAKMPNDTFTLIAFPQVKFVFARNTSIVDLLENGEKYSMKKYKLDTNITVQQLQPYVGTYHCPELDCKYGIVIKDKKLYLTNNKYNDTEIKILGSDHMTSENWWMSHMVLTRDANKKITGFEVNSGRIMHLKFNKIK